MSLAAKLPWIHRHAGGFPGIGSQSLPTDSDCLTYLAAVAAADGAGVEVGVATAVDTFFSRIKADGLFEAIKASCILCGARTLTGALVPMVGTAPTNLPVANGFVAGDYSRTAGLKGDGTSYLDSGRANDADPQDDNHNAIYLTQAYSNGSTFEIGASVSAGRNMINVAANVFTRCRDATEINTGISSGSNGLVGFSRNSSAGYEVRAYGSEHSATAPSDGLASDNVFVFAGNNGGSPIVISSARLAFYSIGTSLDLAALDTAVDNLISDIGNAL